MSISTCHSSASFAITERVSGEFRGEFFNFTNTPHFNNPGGTLGNANFGEVNGAFDPRQVQLGLKFVF